MLTTSTYRGYLLSTNANGLTQVFDSSDELIATYLFPSIAKESIDFWLNAH